MEIPEPIIIKKGRPVGTIRVVYETKEEKYKNIIPPITRNTKKSHL